MKTPIHLGFKFVIIFFISYLKEQSIKEYIVGSWQTWHLKVNFCIMKEI